MDVVICDGPCQGVALQGQYGSSHLAGPISRPAVCMGYDSYVARQHLGHREDEKPPESHRQAAVTKDIALHYPEKASGDAVAPHEDCTCGYYISWKLSAVGVFGTWVVRVPLYVVGLGAYCLYTEGARLARYRVLQWWLPPWVVSAIQKGEPFYWGGLKGYTWRDVVAELERKLGRPPRDDDPAKVTLPTGKLATLPEEVASWMGDDAGER